MNLFQKLTEKPWVTQEGTVVAFHDGREFSLPTAAIGLRVFLAVVTVLFSLLVLAYGSRMAVEIWRPLPEPWLLWLNTVVLILASVAFQWARTSAHRGRTDGVRRGLHAGGAFTFAFLAGQLVAWSQLSAVNNLSPTNPANTFFYLITALHGLHLLGGLVVWGKTTAKVWRGFGAVHVRSSVDLCTVYWHFMLLVWVVLFGVLFQPGASLPAFCRYLAP